MIYYCNHTLSFDLLYADIEGEKRSPFNTQLLTLLSVSAKKSKCTVFFHTVSVKALMNNFIVRVSAEMRDLRQSIENS